MLWETEAPAPPDEGNPPSDEPTPDDDGDDE